MSNYFLRFLSIFLIGFTLLAACSDGVNNQKKTFSAQVDADNTDSKPILSPTPQATSKGEQTAVLREAVFGGWKPFLNTLKESAT